jgi:hypothetical protein
VSVPTVFTASFKSVLLYYVSMVSSADKFAAALNNDLSGTDLSEGVDAALGSTSVLVSMETNTQHQSLVSRPSVWMRLLGGSVVVDWSKGMLQCLVRGCVLRKCYQYSVRTQRRSMGPVVPSPDSEDNAQVA